MPNQHLFDLLESRRIPYKKYDHPAVFTVEKADYYLADAPGARTKNLFVSDQKKRKHFLLWTISTKRVDLRLMGDLIGIRKPRFGSESKMMEYLGITPGAVSILSLINDTENQVDLIIDQELWPNESFQCHPLVNTATLVIPKSGIERFLESVNHSYQIMSFPESI